MKVSDKVILNDSGWKYLKTYDILSIGVERNDIHKVELVQTKNFKLRLKNGQPFYCYMSCVKIAKGQMSLPFNL